MKKLLYILFSICLLTACSDDDPIIDDGGNNGGTTQNYTSFVVTNESKSDLPLIVVSYYKNGVYHKISTASNFDIGKSTEEIKIDDNYINDIYLFISTYGTGESYKIVDPIQLKSNNRNTFIYTSSTKAIIVKDITDQTQYPQ